MGYGCILVGAPRGRGAHHGGPWGAHEKKSRTGAPKKFFPAMVFTSRNLFRRISSRDHKILGSSLGWTLLGIQIQIGATSLPLWTFENGVHWPHSWGLDPQYRPGAHVITGRCLHCVGAPIAKKLPFHIDILFTWSLSKLSHITIPVSFSITSYCSETKPFMKDK